MRGPRVTAARVFGVVVLGLLLLVLWDSQRSWREAKRGEDAERARSAPPPETGLAPRPLSGRERSDPTPTPDVVPGPVPPRGSPSAGGEVETRVRLMLRSTEGPAEPLAISKLTIHGEDRPVTGTPADGYTILIVPRSVVRVETVDERAAFPRIFAWVGEDVPSSIVVETPPNDDPRLWTMTVEVVDATTKAPIPGAVIDRLGSPGPRPAIADDRGRIDLVLTTGGAAGHVARLLTHGFFVHARGYRSSGLALRREDVGALDSPQIADFLGRGVWRVELTRSDLEERSIRFIDADDRPVVDALVLVAYAPRAGIVGGMLTRPIQLTAGYFRTDADGVVRFGVRDVMVVQLFLEHVPFVSWGLSKLRMPSDGPRELRVPGVAQARISLVDELRGNGSWGRDPIELLLGAARGIQDPTVAPDIVDPEFGAAFEKEEIVNPIRIVDRSFEFERQDPDALRLQIPVGVTTRLFVARGNEVRILELRPERPGPFDVTPRWADMPRWTPSGGGYGEPEDPDVTPVPK